MTIELIDDPARERTRTEVGHSLVVDAGAGTGKTSALVARVATSVLADGVPLAETAVVTFTEKAGAELRDRLRAEFERHHRDAAGDEERARALAALEDLDGAAIGTLHSFAQRILAAFPIQAGMPPVVEVLDEVGSSVAFEARWSQTWRELLDDERLSAPLELLLAANIGADQLRSLMRALGNDWDLIASHVVHEPAPAMVLPEVDALRRQAIVFSGAAARCSDPADLFLAVTTKVTDWVARSAPAGSDVERHGFLRELAGLTTGRGGKKTAWPDLPTLKADCKALAAAAGQLATAMSDAALRPVAHWLGTAVLAAARERVASGSLEFHDLLVASRDLLRRDAGARGQLQTMYRRLLLDEFQDTDPIQIELAVRIAGGVDAEAPDWRDVVVAPGSLFVVGDPKQSIYRFRRASIETYLEAAGRLGERLSLVTNFRSVPGVIDWVNTVFAQVIQEKPRQQPAYQALHAARVDDGAMVGAPVTVLGSTAHPKGTRVGPQRVAEAEDVAAVIATALAEGWTVLDRDTRRVRLLTARDIAVLVPARTSLPFLEDALESAGIAYRTESSSLVYQADEIRSLLSAARAIADPSDQLACVTALRSALFGCGDDDLFTYRRDGGSFTVSAPVREELATTPVGTAMTFLHDLFGRSRWLTPAEVLTELAVRRRVLETATLTERASRARDHWGRVRFVIDQARAWSDVEHGGLREYLAWARHQAQDAARVAESLLPETDLDVVRIMTIHAAKGLEFGMVVLSGMTSYPRNQTGVRLLWKDDGYAVRLSSAIETNDFGDAAPLDEQMDGEERRRLLYVAATRARDHLVVSLHRAEGSTAATAARVFVDAGALEVPGVRAFSADDDARPGTAGQQEPAVVGAGAPSAAPPWEEWAAQTRVARERARAVAVRTASGLEGTEPEVAWAVAAVDDEAAADTGARDEVPAEVAEGSAKGARDVDLAPWLKGRYGNLIGRAVHGTLQAVAGDESMVDGVAAAQALAEGVPTLAAEVAAYVHSALSTDVVRRAFAGEHWSELYVGAVEHDGILLEGFIDLLFRESPERGGELVIVDYKTDAVAGGSALAERARFYSPQIEAYVRALEAATGERARAELVFLDPSGGAGRCVAIDMERSA